MPDPPQQRDQEAAESEAERVATPPDFSSAPEGASVQAWKGRHYLVLRSGEYREWGLLSPISRPLVERALSHERQLREEAERRLEVVQRNHGDRVGECAAERQARKAAEAVLHNCDEAISRFLRCAIPTPRDLNEIQGLADARREARSLLDSTPSSE